jgi:hypothetical protein
MRLSYAGGTLALATETVVGSPEVIRNEVYETGTEELVEGEIRVSILGSGLPWVVKAQAAGSVLMEVGNPERDVFVFDLGAGALANFSALKVPVTSLKKVFLSHLHADHVADYVTLMGSYTKAGRRDPVEVWGGASNKPEWGTAAFALWKERDRDRGADSIGPLGRSLAQWCVGWVGLRANPTFIASYASSIIIMEESVMNTLTVVVPSPLSLSTPSPENVESPTGARPTKSRVPCCTSAVTPPRSPQTRYVPMSSGP